MGRVPLCAPAGHTVIMTPDGPTPDVASGDGDPSTWMQRPQRVTNPLMALTKLHHLVPRFLGSLSDTPPSADDEAWVAEHLLDGERSLWAQLSNQDRRHSVTVARRFVEVRPQANRAQIAGAILHDIGKIECGLGPYGRVVATLVGRRTARFRSYHDHEDIGAQMVADAGSDPATIQLVGGAGPAFGDLHRCDHA